MGDGLSDVLFRTAATGARASDASSHKPPDKENSGPLSGRQLTIHNEESAYDVIKNYSFSDMKSAAMCDMPELVQEEVKRYAAVKLSMLWLPRVMLASKQKQRKVVAPEGDNKLSKIIQVLKSGELISFWPSDRLQYLADSAIPVAVQKGDRIITEGESCRSGLWLILSGKGFMTKKQKSPNRNTPAQEVVVHRFTAPVLIGDFALLTDEPRTASVHLDSEGSCFVLQRTCFLKELGLLSQKHQQEIYDRAFQRRQKNIASFFPRTINDIRSSMLLADVSDPDAETLLQSLQPLCIRQGIAIITKGAPGKCIFFLCRGKAESQDHYGGDTVVHTSTQNATFGEMAFIFDGNKYNRTIVSEQHCDMWTLPFSAINELLKNPTFRQRVYTNIAAMRMTHLRKLTNLNEHIESCTSMMQRTAILGEICSRSFLHEVAQRMVPQVFLPRETIVSAVEQCDKLCIITSGKAIVQNNLTPKPTLLHNGDVIGTSLVAIHRWLFPVQAIKGCDVWSISKPELVQMLQQHGYYPAFFAVVKRMVTEFQFLPLKVMLGRRKAPGGRYLIPPLLYPCQGLPSGIAAPYQFEPLLKDQDYKSIAADDKDSPAAKVGPEKGKIDAMQVASKKLWVVLNQKAPAQKGEKLAKELEFIPTAPPRQRREMTDVEDLLTALDTIATPSRHHRRIMKTRS